MRLPRPVRQTGYLLSLGAMLAGTTVLTLVTYGETDVATQFHYIPIIISAFLFGTFGALICAVVAGFLAGPYLLITGRVGDAQWLPWITRFLFYAVIGLITSRLSATIMQQAKEFQALFHVAQAINSSLRPSSVLRRIVRHARNRLRIRAVSIRLLDPKTGELALAASEGLSPSYIAKGKVDVDSSAIDRQALDGQTVVVEDVARSDQLQYAEEVRSEGIGAIMVVPLKSKRRPLGVFRAYASKPKRFRKAERSLIEAFANQAATAIENAELYDSLRQSYFETVRSLTRTLEARDPATAGHSERVTHLVALIGERLGLRRDEIDLLRFGAVLHDIGKVGIGEDSLGTMGPANGTPADLLFQTHPLIGESILQPVSFLEPVLPMVTCHHEYLDGSGYPEGLRGEAIPFFGRLAAAANEFDRLVSAWEGDPLEAIGAAREQIRVMAGTKLDAEIVDVLLQVTESMQELTGERGDLDLSADRDADAEDEDED